MFQHSRLKGWWGIPSPVVVWNSWKHVWWWAGKSPGLSEAEDFIVQVVLNFSFLGRRLGGDGGILARWNGLKNRLFSYTIYRIFYPLQRWALPPFLENRSNLKTDEGQYLRDGFMRSRRSNSANHGAFEGFVIWRCLVTFQLFEEVP